MKKKTLKRVSIAALALALSTGSVLAGTLARYQSTFTATDATYTVAKWDVTVNGEKGGVETTATSFDLTNTIKQTDTTKLAENKIAPGVDGGFDVVVLNNSEVAAQFTLNLKVTAKTGTLPANLIVKIDGTDVTTDAIATDGKTTAAADLAIASGTKTVKVTWEWAYAPDDSAERVEDTTDGLAATLANVQFDVEVVAWQVEPGVAAQA